MTATSDLERDAQDLKLHRVIAHALNTVQMQFGLTRSDTLDHFECFIELEREEDEETRYRRGLEPALASDSS